MKNVADHVKKNTGHLFRIRELEVGREIGSEIPCFFPVIEDEGNDGLILSFIDTCEVGKQLCEDERLCALCSNSR